MIERSLPKMPRKVKNSKSKKGRGNSEASGRNSKNNKSLDSVHTDDETINDGEENLEYEKVMVPVEVLTKN